MEVGGQGPAGRVRAGEPLERRAQRVGAGPRVPPERAELPRELQEAPLGGGGTGAMGAAGGTPGGRPRAT
ncbi:MAG: hypothetical protein A2W08_13460 [Candidatus Rokubacteria bacterium RBG_16_73_20]|nr:MAG: hypothetical protein A2W08_13460 [Candidatus Rokubacteria bacterium RBG_16_73_20]